MRAPIMFCWPNKLTPVDRPELVSSIDLVPTLLAAADQAYAVAVAAADEKLALGAWEGQPCDQTHYDADIEAAESARQASTDDAMQAYYASYASLTAAYDSAKATSSSTATASMSLASVDRA